MEPEVGGSSPPTCTKIRTHRCSFRLDAGLRHQFAHGVHPALRRGKDGHAFVTDGGHWILDAALTRIDDPVSLAHAISGVPGVVEHGLFIGLTHMAIVGGPDGVEIVRGPEISS